MSHRVMSAVTIMVLQDVGRDPLTPIPSVSKKILRIKRVRRICGVIAYVIAF